MSRRWIGWVMAVSGAMALAGCGGQSTEAGPEPDRGNDAPDDRGNDDPVPDPDPYGEGEGQCLALCMSGAALHTSLPGGFAEVQDLPLTVCRNEECYEGELQEDGSYHQTIYDERGPLYVGVYVTDRGVTMDWSAYAEEDFADGDRYRLSFGDLVVIDETVQYEMVDLCGDWCPQVVLEIESKIQDDLACVVPIEHGECPEDYVPYEANPVDIVNGCLEPSVELFCTLGATTGIDCKIRVADGQRFAVSEEACFPHGEWADCTEEEREETVSLMSCEAD